MRFPVFALLLGSLMFPHSVEAQGPDNDARAIRQVIENAYLRGVFVDRSPAAVRAGFHPAFVMSVLDGDSIIVAPLEMWLARLGLDGEPSSDSVRHLFELVDVTDDTAVAKLQLWINGEHTYTDYFGLYRFAEGWRIVTKVFASHD